MPYLESHWLFFKVSALLEGGAPMTKQLSHWSSSEDTVKRSALEKSFRTIWEIRIWTEDLPTSIITINAASVSLSQIWHLSRQSLSVWWCQSDCLEVNWCLFERQRLRCSSNSDNNLPQLVGYRATLPAAQSFAFRGCVRTTLAVPNSRWLTSPKQSMQPDALLAPFNLAPL